MNTPAEVLNATGLRSLDVLDEVMGVEIYADGDFVEIGATAQEKIQEAAKLLPPEYVTNFQVDGTLEWDILNAASAYFAHQYLDKGELFDIAKARGTVDRDGWSMTVTQGCSGDISVRLRK